MVIDIEEIWRDIEGFKGYYQVSNKGRVRSLDRTVIYKDGREYFYPGKILKPDIDKGGYLQVVLSKNSELTTRKIHRLVASAFVVNNNPKYTQINHIDEKREIYSAILTNNKNGILMDILFDVADKDIKERIEDNKQDITKDIPSEIITKFYLGAIVNIGMEWIRDNSKYKKEDILKYFNILIPDKI